MKITQEGDKSRGKNSVTHAYGLWNLSALFFRKFSHSPTRTLKTNRLSRSLLSLFRCRFWGNFLECVSVGDAKRGVICLKLSLCEFSLWMKIQIRFSSRKKTILKIERERSSIFLMWFSWMIPLIDCEWSRFVSRCASLLLRTMFPFNFTRFRI